MKANTKRTTIYLDSDLHHALRIKAAQTEHSMSELVQEAIKLQTEHSMSELVQEAIKLSLAEDSIDLSAFNERKKEPSLPFEDVLKKLRKNGKI